MINKGTTEGKQAAVDCMLEPKLSKTQKDVLLAT